MEQIDNKTATIMPNISTYPVEIREPSQLIDSHPITKYIKHLDGDGYTMIDDQGNESVCRGIDWERLEAIRDWEWEYEDIPIIDRIASALPYLQDMVAETLDTATPEQIAAVAPLFDRWHEGEEIPSGRIVRFSKGLYRARKNTKTDSKRPPNAKGSEKVYEPVVSKSSVMADSETEKEKLF